MSPAHLYLVLDCKTADCGYHHIVKYIGEKDSLTAGEGIPIGMPSGFRMECPRCRSSYQYQIGDLRRVEMDAPPPSGFRNAI